MKMIGKSILMGYNEVFSAYAKEKTHMNIGCKKAGYEETPFSYLSIFFALYCCKTEKKGNFACMLIIFLRIFASINYPLPKK